MGPTEEELNEDLRKEVMFAIEESPVLREVLLSCDESGLRVNGSSGGFGIVEKIFFIFTPKSSPDEVLKELIYTSDPYFRVVDVLNDSNNNNGEVWVKVTTRSTTIFPIVRRSINQYSALGGFEEMKKHAMIVEALQ